MICKNEGAVRWREKRQRNPRCSKWITYKCAVHADISRDDRVHTSANRRRWGFNSKVTNVSRLTKLFFLFFCLVPMLHYFTKHKNRHLLYKYTYMSRSVHGFALIGHRCFVIQSISLGFRALTENQARLLTPCSPSPSLQHPSQQQEFYQSFLGEKRRGNVIWKRGANAPQQQLFPNHSNLGKGCGLYFMGEVGRMFIYLSPQSALRCMCMSVLVSRYLAANFLLL